MNVPTIIEKNEKISIKNNNVDVIQSKSLDIIKINNKDVVINGKKESVDPYQLMGLIKNVTQTIGEYKIHNNVFSYAIIVGLRKSRRELVTKLEEIFGIHWKIDKLTGESIFFI